MEQNFWRTVPLAELDQSQWEALCDRCGKCCLHRFETGRDRKVVYTNVCCRHLSRQNGSCRVYPNRLEQVPDCVDVTVELLCDPRVLPQSCAYRLLAEKRELPWWHPLVSGNPHTVVESGNFVGARVVSELDVDNLEHHMIDWIE